MSKEKKKTIMSYLILAVATLIITNVVLSCFSPSIVNGVSMLPKLNDGDYVILSKFVNNIDYNDLVIIDYNPNSLDERYIVKRVIGLPGDKIEFIDNQLYRNGLLIKEDYLNSEMKNEPNRTIVIPKGKVYVLGDNRDNSIDSRHFGYIDIEEHIVAKVILKF